MIMFRFSCHDNGGKFQSFTYKAKDKADAIKKGMERARKHARGDISPDWKCELIRCY